MKPEINAEAEKSTEALRKGLKDLAQAPVPLIKQMRMQCPIAFPGEHTRMPKRVKACIKPNANGDMYQPLKDIHDQSLHQQR